LILFVPKRKSLSRSKVQKERIQLLLVFRVLAFALLAVGFFDSSALDRTRAAVAFIVPAGTVVVLVVAVAIANVIWNRALGFAAFDSVLGILANARFAVRCFDLSALDRTRTAVAAIEFAATVVVLVVAVAVALVLLETACSFAVFIFLVIRVLAFALLAVGFFDIFTAAVAFIVSAGTVVVLVVAVAIANVLWYRAFGIAAFDFVLGILALALFAVSCFDSSALDRTRTAVAAIVFAATVVVLVVAVAVALVLLETAFSITRRPSGDALAFDKFLSRVAFDTRHSPIFFACFTHRSDAVFTFALVWLWLGCGGLWLGCGGDLRFNASVLAVRFEPLDARTTNSFCASQFAGRLVGVGANFDCLFVAFWRALARTTSTTALEVLFKCLTSESTTTLYKPLIARFAVAFQQCQLIVA